MASKRVTGRRASRLVTPPWAPYNGRVLEVRVLPLLAAVLSGAALGGCNALWGIDGLGYDAPGASTTSTGGTSGGGSGTGGHGGGGGAGAAGGTAGAGGAGGQPCSIGPFGPATLVAELSTAAGEWDPAIAHDELTIYFASNRSGGSGGTDIWVASRTTVTEPFGPAEPLENVNYVNSDIDPHIAPDGLTLWFSSRRPGGTGEMDLFTASRTTASEPFGTPTEQTDLNTGDDDRDPTLSTDGLTIFFSSDRPGGLGDEDIWTATRPAKGSPFGTAQLVTAVNTPEPDTNPALSADGLTLYFDTHLTGGVGVRDIWFVTRPTPAGPFGAVTNVGAPNSTLGDFDPSPSASGLVLYFTSDRAGGPGGGDLWRAERSCE